MLQNAKLCLDVKDYEINKYEPTRRILGFEPKFENFINSAEAETIAEKLIQQLAWIKASDSSDMGIGAEVHWIERALL
jgi:hypothetical protein